jgi:hypothetical protein
VCYQDVEIEWPEDNEKVGYIKDDVRGTANHSICVTEEETCFAAWYLLL